LTGCFCSVSVLSCFFFSSRRRHTRFSRDWSSDVCSSDLVPRLQGHSAQDTQAYKSEELLKAEWARDPLPRLESFLVGLVMSEGQWDQMARDAEAAIAAACAEAEARPIADPEGVTRHVFYEGEMQERGGQWTMGYVPPLASDAPRPEGQRINMGAAIRRTLDQELEL